MLLILIIDDGFPVDKISKLRITSTELNMDGEISSIVFANGFPLIFADVEIKGAFILTINSFKILTGVILKAISLASLDK